MIQNRQIKTYFTSMSFFVLGLVCFFLVLFFLFQTQLKNTELISGDPGDARFNNYTLEHQWLSITGTRSLFDSHFFYPEKSTLFYSDTLLTASFPYLISRSLGYNPFFSFQLWIYSCLLLTFLSCLFCFNYWFKNKLLNILAAVFCTFALPKMYQIGHAQLLCQYFSILSLHYFFKYYQNRIEKDFLLFIVFAVLQFYSSWYYGWFLYFLILILFIVFILKAELRNELFNFIKANKKKLLPIIIFGIVLLLPLGIGYFWAFHKSGGRPYAEAKDLLPTFFSWLAYPEYHWVNNVIPFFKNIQTDSALSERTLGLGYVFLILYFICFLTLWKKNILKPLLITLLTIFILSLRVGNHSLWIRVFEMVPLAKSIRAVARIGLFLIPIQTFLVLYCINKFIDNKKQIAFVLIFLLILAEQAVPVKYYYDSRAMIDRLKPVLEKISSNCKSFYLVGKKEDFFVFNNLDAMTINIFNNIPTVNGYSGNSPPNYSEKLLFSNQKDADDLEQKKNALHNWSIQETCLIEK